MKKQIEKDFVLIRSIDLTDVELPYGVSDWIEGCLKSLDEDIALSPQDHLKAGKILRYIEMVADA